VHGRAVVDGLRVTAGIITDCTTYTGLPAIVLELDTSQCGEAVYAQPINLDWNSTERWRYGLVDPENAASLLWSPTSATHRCPRPRPRPWSNWSSNSTVPRTRPATSTDPAPPLTEQAAEVTTQPAWLRSEQGVPHAQQPVFERLLRVSSPSMSTSIVPKRTRPVHRPRRAGCPWR